jgi:cytochrome d ubiquinol oxidase subunit I
MLSIMATHNPDGIVKGLKDFPADERPPVLPVYLSFRLMVALGGLFILISLLAVVLSWRNLLEKYPLFLKLLVLLIPLPYLANQLGWIVAEMGRQPWIVYGVMKTSDAVSKSISVSQVVASLIGFVLLYSLLGFVDIFLLAKYARKGPDSDLSTLIKPSGRSV